jgi:hypothetical protein
MDEILMGLLSPEQQAAAQQRAQQAGLLNLGFGLLQASRGAPGQGRPGLGQIVGQAGPGALQAYQGSFDQTLRNIMLKQQMDEAQARRAQQQTQQAAVESYISGLPADQQSRFRAFPTQAAESMFREAPEQFQQLTAEETAARGLPANKIFQVSTKTGKVSEVGGGGATVNVGGQQDPFDVDVAKQQAKNFSEIANAGRVATGNLRKVNRLENILGKVETGGAAAFKQIAGNFGIKTEGLDEIQAATAIINSLVPEQRQEGSGPMSDADLELFKQSLPRIINTPGGNKLIIEGLKDINQYLIEEGKIANDVLAKKITREEGRQKLLELGNPIEEFFGQNQAASPGSPRVQLPRADEDLINRYLRR